MAERVPMLALSPTMESGRITSWLKREGDEIAIGDVLCEVETDKATMEYESVQEGTLLKILTPEGHAATIEQTIAIVGEAGEDIAELLAELKDIPEASDGSDAAAPASPVALSTESPTSVAPGDARVKASPLARRMAETAGLSLSSISGSGPDGRIVKRDVEAAVSSDRHPTEGPTPAPVRSGDVAVAVSNKRRLIAQRLAESKYSAPHFYLKASVCTETMMEARKRLNSSLDRKVSVNAFLIKFAAEAIKKHPDINASWEGEVIRRFADIDIGLAVAQTDGLITPIVRNCGAKGVLAIDAELSDLIVRAKSNKLAPEEYTGATFSISSLGTFGIEEFTAIINPPGSAILAVGEMRKVPIVDESDRIVARTQMKLTLSCDHRVIDGAKGAEFLNELKNLLENPIRALY